MDRGLPGGAWLPARICACPTRPAAGEPLHHGNALPALNNCGLDAAFYTAKGANFNPNRAAIFRYAISTSQGAGCPGGAIGGQGEIGGNDFIDYNQDGGTIIHELGHNLTLGHGGNEDNNCKPNYVSTMNYDSAFGILRAGGGMILDYSPPRINLNGATRGNAPLANLVESSLNETVSLDAGDVSNRFVTISRGQKLAYVVDARFDEANEARIVALAQHADLFYCESPYMDVDA